MNIMTFVILLLVAVVAGLAWVLLMQRQRVVSADGPIIDQGGGPLDIAFMAVERLSSRSTAKGEDIMDARTSNAAAVPANDGTARESLFPMTEADDFRHQWDAIQASFVDEPRQAVEEADRLVASAVKRLSETFAADRQSFTRSGDVSTEDLRLALKRYKSYFSRLMAI
jgi:hypothetical protein